MYWKLQESSIDQQDIAYAVSLRLHLCRQMYVSIISKSCLLFKKLFRALAYFLQNK